MNVKKQNQKSNFHSHVLVFIYLFIFIVSLGWRDGSAVKGQLGSKQRIQNQYLHLSFVTFQTCKMILRYKYFGEHIFLLIDS